MTIVEWNTKSAGDAMPDGSVYAGISPETRGVFFTTPTDAPLTYTFNEAAEYAKRLNAEKYLGHDDWRLPSKYELNVLWENRNKGKLKGTFNETGADDAGWYWSSSPNFLNAWAQRFSDGCQFDYARGNGMSLRCVR